MRVINKLFLLLFLFIVSFALPKTTWAGSINIEFDPINGYGNINQHLVIAIPPSISSSQVQELTTQFINTKTYLKVNNPTTAFLSSSSFISLKNDFGWYFNFQNSQAASAFLSSTASNLPTNTVIQIMTPDSSGISTLAQNYPNINIHTGNILYWQRDEAKSILDSTPPPTIEAISFYVDEKDLQGTQYDKIKLMFDTLFDASSDVPGTSEIKLRYPANSKLSLVGISTKSPSGSQALSFTTGVISSAIVTAIQTQGKAKKAPIKYIVINNYFTASSSEKLIYQVIAKIIGDSPNVLWPIAVGPNGAPYDINDNYTIVGVVGYKNNGYYMLFTNCASSPTTLGFSKSVDFSSHYSVSNTKGENVYSGVKNSILLDSLETVAIYSKNISISPTPIPTIKPQPTLPPQIPTPTPSSKSPSITNIIEYPIKPQPTATNPFESIEPKQEAIIKRININVSIENPYEPYRQITKAVLIINDQEIPVLEQESTVSVVVNQTSGPYKLFIETNDGHTFEKSSNYKIDSENSITIVLGNPLLFMIKNVATTLFVTGEKIVNQLAHLDKQIQFKISK
jgi:hypothetical protein